MFVRVSDWVVVNLEQIEYVDFHNSTVNLIGGGTVYTDQAYQDSILDALLNYKN